MGRGERGTRVAAARKPKVTKTSGLYREEPLAEGQPSPWAAEFRIKGGVFKSYPVRK